MGLHTSFDRAFFVSSGLLQTGRSLDLAKGQLGFFKGSGVNKRGYQAITSFAGMPKRETFHIKLGMHQDLPVTRSQNNYHASTFPFSLKDVVDVRVSRPERNKQVLDELVIGYDGINPDTAIKLRRGEVKKVSVKMSGELIGMLTGTNCITISTYLQSDSCYPFSDCADCDKCEYVDCVPLIEAALQDLRNQEIRGGIKASEVVEFTPVYRCTDPVAETLVPHVFRQLEVCDTGDEAALGAVQAQYPGFKIERVKRVGATSTYQTLVPTSEGAFDDYEQTLPSIFPGCEDCPAGYTETPEGLLYAVSLEDDGAVLSATVETLPNAVAASTIKQGQVDGVGFYTVLLTQALTDAEIQAFVTANPTATVEFVNTVDSICNNTNVNTASWDDVQTCDASTRQFTITLPDNECGEDRLAELQQAYPHLNIGLEGTTGGCQTKYITTVNTNIACEECDPIFVDSFRADAPQPFDQVAWEPVAVIGQTDCLCGIRVKAKDLRVEPSECIKDIVGYVESSVMLQASGGYLTEVREGIGEITDDSFNVIYLNRWQPRTHVGGNLWDLEDRNRVFFTGQERDCDDNVSKFFKEEESHIDTTAQYIDYAVTLKRSNYAQSFSQEVATTTTFHIFVKIGDHVAIETALNSLAANAGLPGIAAFGA